MATPLPVPDEPQVCDYLPVASNETLQLRRLMPVRDFAQEMHDAGWSMGLTPAALHGVQDPENDQEHERSPQSIRRHWLS